MGETYRGYQITIAWNSETTGYDLLLLRRTMGNNYK